MLWKDGDSTVMFTPGWAEKYEDISNAPHWLRSILWFGIEKILQLTSWIYLLNGDQNSQKA